MEDCMATETRSFREIFPNENSNNSDYWSDYPVVLKLKKNDFQSESLCNANFEIGLNQFKCKPNSMQALNQFKCNSSNFAVF